VGAHVLVANVEECVAVDGEGRSLAVELEDDESRVVACSIRSGERREEARLVRRREKR
jgi:hypothetical protein